LPSFSSSTHLCRHTSDDQLGDTLLLEALMQSCRIEGTFARLINDPFTFRRRRREGEGDEFVKQEGGDDGSFGGGSSSLPWSSSL